jgi:putative transcriptional regulator
MARKAFDKISEGLNEAIAIARGDVAPARVLVPTSIDVKAIRKRLGFTQAAFADRFGFSVQAVRDWEQGRSSPEGATRAYLLVIDREPEAVERALWVA